MSASESRLQINMASTTTARKPSHSLTNPSVQCSDKTLLNSQLLEYILTPTGFVNIR
jgi:hypothetical protein